MIRLRSAAAVFVGLLAVFVLSLGTDQILHQLQFYPPWDQGMHDPFQNAVALFYRCVYAVLGGYIAAKFAPFKPIAHALVLGGIGFLLALTGYFATRHLNFGPAWYPLALVVTAIPCSWSGGVLQQRMLKRH
jgi:hypothetical protein